MNDKEEALKNYFKLLKYINELNAELIERFFNLKYIYASDREAIFNENNEINKLLMGNYFLMAQFKILYNSYYKEDITYLENFIKKKKLNRDLFRDDIEDIKRIYINFKNNYEVKLSNEHKDEIENKAEIVHENIKEYHFLVNESWKLGIKISNKYDELNFDYKTKFFESNNIKELAKSVILRFPFKTIFLEINENIRNFNDRIIDELEDKGYFKE